MLTLFEWQQKIKNINELIIRASRVDLSDLPTNHPIGYHHDYLSLNLDIEKVQIGDHKKLILCSFNTETDDRRKKFPKNRKTIANTLEKNGFKNEFTNPKDYYLNLSSYKFIVSPEGQGIDNYRTYEALISGCIPIVENHPLIKEVYGNCPILFTNDYTEITEEYLQQKYNEMLHKQYDFSKLLIQNWSQEEQNNIKTRGNYWCKKYINILPYPEHKIIVKDSYKKLLFVHVNGHEYLKIYNLFIQTLEHFLGDVDLLIITTEEFKNQLILINNLYDIKNVFFHITKYHNHLGKFSGKLDIIDWEYINNYEKIIYSDIDILYFPKSLDVLFDTIIQKDTLYTVSERIHFTNSFFYHKEIYSEQELVDLFTIGYVSGFNTGLWGWLNNNTSRIISQLKIIRENINNKCNLIQTDAGEQPYINHRFLVDGNFDFSFGYYVSLYPEEAVYNSYLLYKQNKTSTFAVHYTFNDKLERMKKHLPLILYFHSLYKQNIEISKLA